ncbi:unnamed protein product [Tetraodon nigroviridis]|uniref:Chromosome 8 SCAF14545, whole genome shotgun sequence n=1 Tax=Tetraodon nigroviridis TaxID=99883 RepID=Q4SMR8_TETNG|nr:unnamed protein product [Tetraodon nigroviridis]
MAPFQELPNRTASDNEQVMGLDACGSGVPPKTIEFVGRNESCGQPIKC